MALEPITRQEQIIAGKDLQPITRMEKFLKEYGGASNPKLLGELVLTNENCTVNSEHTTLYFEDELEEQIQSLFSACGNHFGGVLVDASLADMRLYATAQYVFGSSQNRENIQFFLIENATTKELNCYSLMNDAFHTSSSNFVQAVMGGYPLTIKVYAT